MTDTMHGHSKRVMMKLQHAYAVATCLMVTVVHCLKSDNSLINNVYVY